MSTFGSTAEDGAHPVFQVRHRNKKQRVKDAKVDVDKKNSYISKKDRKRATVNVSEQEKSTILAAKPLDNVGVHKFYPVQHFSIQEVLLRHKASAQPAMLDNMRRLFYLSMRLDLITKKKAPEKMKLATSLGTKLVGTPEEVLKIITSGVLKATVFKHVLCTTDCGTEILPLRNYLRDTFPQKVAPPSPEEIALRVEDNALVTKNEEVDSDEEEEMSMEAA
ncbi:uncharacterized protein LOC131927153 [Physella acuta]|uniref:uncharacterized protein LOC131927153 n=1 Tax=Physella acuta TaxID=109671 RepID=UPI0027DDBC20|nr:uncharacterized protein LOC131927153 [Physella acuta]